ncbi:hypothetical protein WQQ_15400 [Hydrocarboniphaga effusa AP103]|uniref:Uncharacterized protein n=1 Tax=Hydrocarboniphaga effusa AP103 TaxID=1172194 RepID=I8TCK8_9GAMM|nr:hypothetical protein WQQ_15400 [Hydrocarboniphaga effusa AP103]
MKPQITNVRDASSRCELSLQRSCGMKPQITRVAEAFCKQGGEWLQRSCGMKPQITSQQNLKTSK